MLLSIFGGGLFIIPLILLAAIVYGFKRYKKERASGSEWWYNGKHYESDEPAPFYACWGFWIMAICGVSFIATVWAMVAAK